MVGLRLGIWENTISYIYIAHNVIFGILVGDLSLMLLTVMTVVSVEEFSRSVRQRKINVVYLL